MPVFAVNYTWAGDPEARREAVPAHRAHLLGLAQEGKLLVSGPLDDDRDPGALLLVRAASREEALALTEHDPFRREGYVASVVAREWVPLSGPLASSFADPAG